MLFVVIYFKFPFNHPKLTLKVKIQVLKFITVLGLVPITIDTKLNSWRVHVNYAASTGWPMLPSRPILTYAQQFLTLASNGYVLVSKKCLWQTFGQWPRWFHKYSFLPIQVRNTKKTAKLSTSFAKEVSWKEECTLYVRPMYQNRISCGGHRNTFVCSGP